MKAEVNATATATVSEHRSRRTSSENECATPSRSSSEKRQSDTNGTKVKIEGSNRHNDSSPVEVKTVTPSEDSSVQRLEQNADGSSEKQVRFGKEGNNSQENDFEKSKIQTTPFDVGVEQRGRYVSPARQGPIPSNTLSQAASPHDSAVLEYKTFRSPARKRDEEVPSLCSSSNNSTTGPQPPAAEKFTKSAPASSISVDHSEGTSSPLGQASHDESDKVSDGKDHTMKDSIGADASHPGEDVAAHALMPMLHASSCLSPTSPPPKQAAILRSSDFNDEKKSVEADEESRAIVDAAMASKEEPKSPDDRDHYCATPTDFTVDYGKTGTNTTAFDTSNVLAWLQSPTAHGLFSPGGGLGSLMNTPAGNAAPRTPRTPTVSTSFFFSDVAGLPKNDMGSPRSGDGSKRQNKGAISNIICISPLASTKGRSASSDAHTPNLNFKDIFASPNERGRSLPLLGDTPSKSDRLRKRRGSKDPSVDAIHLAERDLIEDEDLSVLLQLASNTPRSTDRNAGGATRDGGGPVFRSSAGKDDDTEGSFPGLQLPMIGNGKDGSESKTRLSQKTRTRDTLDGDTFGPPQLGMRSSSSHAKDHKSQSHGGVKEDEKKEAKEKGPEPKPSKNGISSSSSYPMPPPYPPPPHGDGHPFYPLAGMPPPGVPPGSSGTMRVVVGGQPPPPPPPPPCHRTSAPGKPGSPSSRPNSSPPPPVPYHEYPPHPGNLPYPPPPPGMYSGYPAYNGMGRYPPYSHYPPPPPRAMPMYSAQHPVGGAPKDPKRAKTVKNSKTPSKRPAEAAEPKPAPVPSATPASVPSSSNPVAKKQKKGSPGGQPRKKNKSPALTDRNDRQKAATTIQAMNTASGGKNDRAAALAAAILRGVTMRPSGKWQAQLYFAGKSRYIGVFDTREKAALAYEIAREKLKSGPQESGALSAKSTENLVNAARKAAFEGVNERVPK